MDDDGDEYYLPLGAHLLPSDFREFLIRWNRDIYEKVGCWYSKDRKKIYKKTHANRWNAFMNEFNTFRLLYRDEIEALKVYQDKHADD